MTYIQPHIDYCSTVWGGTAHSNLDRIHRLQKRAVKIILDYEYSDIACSMNDLKILNIYERIFLRKAKFMYKISKSITPSYINAMFTFRPINETLLSLRSVNTCTRYIKFSHSKATKRNFQAKFNLLWASHME